MSVDHDKEFDGIKQADNKMPSWYVIAFVLSLIWGCLYIAYYMATDFQQEAQFKDEVTAHKAQFKQASFDASAINPFAGDAEAISRGEKHFQTRCAACHKADMTGLVGPNLIDKEWVFSNKDTVIFDVIMNGRTVNPGKVMPPHNASLGPKKVWEVVAFLQSKNQDIQISAPATAEETE